MIRILVADDHALVRHGLIQILARQPDMGDFGEAGTVAETLQQAATRRWDIVLLDLTLPDGSGLDALRALRERYPDIAVLVLTMHPEDQLAIRLLKAGAAGYLTKEAAPEELVRAIRQILRGHRYLSPAMTQALADGIGDVGVGLPHELLSARELEVLRLLAVGRPVKDIAQRLRVSPKTITTYRARMLKKMGLRSNADLTLYASRHALIPAAAPL